jgi:hypothetical protein
MLKSALGEPGWVGRAENPKASCRQPLVGCPAKRAVTFMVASPGGGLSCCRSDVYISNHPGILPGPEIALGSMAREISPSTHPAATHQQTADVSGLPLAEEVAREGRALETVCSLLTSETPFSEWPPLLGEALAEALHPTFGSHQETAKAAMLERHLFGVVGAPEIPRSEQDVGRIADRLRADLADLMPFGAGFHLISYDKVAREWMTPARSA